MPRIGDKLRSYSKRELERRVDQFVGQRPYLSPPIQADTILHRMPRVKRIRPMTCLVERFHTETMAFAPVFVLGELEVLVDQKTLDQRDGGPVNMALAETIGHIELHPDTLVEIQSEADFLELRKHPKWIAAEGDARYYGRALLMPGAMLEPAAAEAYRFVAAETGFGDYGKFSQLMGLRLAGLFEAPPAEVHKRVGAYVGGLRSRIDLSIASRSLELLGLRDEVSVHRPHFDNIRQAARD